MARILRPFEAENITDEILEEFDRIARSLDILWSLWHGADTDVDVAIFTEKEKQMALFKALEDHAYVPIKSVSAGEGTKYRYFLKNKLILDVHHDIPGGDYKFNKVQYKNYQYLVPSDWRRESNGEIFIDIGGWKVPKEELNGKKEEDIRTVGGKWRIMDICPFADYEVDLREAILMPLPDSSVAAMYTSETVEHVNQERLDWFFSEVYRVLKQDGWFRVVVPDFDLAIKKYVEGDVAWLKKEWVNKKMEFPDISLCYLINMVNTVSRPLGHRTAFNDELLVFYLEKHGFKNIRKKSFNDCNPVFVGKDYRKYKDESIYYEAEKI